MRMLVFGLILSLAAIDATASCREGTSAPSGNFEILEIQKALLPCGSRISPDKEKRTLELTHCSLRLKDKKGESFLVLGTEADCNRKVGEKLKLQLSPLCCDMERFILCNGSMSGEDYTRKLTRNGLACSMRNVKYLMPAGK